MKKLSTPVIAFIIASVFLCTNAFSQKTNNRINKSEAVTEMLSGGYSFSYDTGAYKSLNGSMNLSAGEIWDDPSYPCPIGFHFKFFNELFDTAWVSDTWEVAFGTDIGDGYNYYITPYGADLIDRGFGSAPPQVPKSPISYLVTGAQPNRILKIEWKNAAFLLEQDSFSTRTNFLNLQLWLFESTNNIEVHYGPHLVTYQSIIFPDMTGPEISLNNHTNIKYYSLSGDSTKPTLTSFPGSYINGTPPDGTIYRFSSGYVDIANNESADYSFYPNPVSDAIHIIHPNQPVWTNVQVYNLLGMQIMNERFDGKNQINLNVNSLPNGTYLLKMHNSKTSITHKFTKQ